MTGLLVAFLLASAAVLLVLRSGRRKAGGTVSAARVAERPGLEDPALILDLLGALLTAGSSVERALSTVSDSCERNLSTALARVHAARLLGASWAAAWEAGIDHRVDDVPSVAGRPAPARAAAFAELREGLRFATSTGAPSAALLHAHAGQLRRRHNREVDRRAAALGVQLVLPLGLCSLPAFICLGVVPVVLGLLPEL